GQLDLATSRQILIELASATAGNPYQHILIDGRDITGPPLSTVDLFELVQTLRSLGLGLLNKLAILRKLRDSFDRGRFFEMLATDRGFNVGVFDDFESAFTWLYGGGKGV